MNTANLFLVFCSLTLAACKNSDAKSSSKSLENTALPKTIRCAQVTEVESIVVHETLLLKLQSNAVSGTYQFTTGERGSIQDAGFQHLFASVTEVSTESEAVRLKLSEGKLSVFFDEEFAPEKVLTEIKLDSKNKTATFSIEGDARETVVGNCQFE